MYKLYRVLPNGKWKNVKTFSSKSDSVCQQLISDYNCDGIAWVLVDSNGFITDLGLGI